MRCLGSTASAGRRTALLTTASCLAACGVAAFGRQVYAASPANEQAPPPAVVGEIVVTASRREQTISKLPFSISAYSGQQLSQANITTVAGLAQQVPNFVIQDQGARAAASAIPIIRGLNVSQPTLVAARYFQSPVGFYLGDAPMTGALPLLDVDRIEVLRGPQGTLYGAGALAGAVRILPDEPQLNRYSGYLSGSGSAVSHSSSFDNDILGAVNIPIGDTLAIRIAAKRGYEAGFIDQNDIMRRAGNNYVSGAPLLADPSDIANSPALYFNEKDVNYDTTSSGRLSVLWKPTEKLKLLASYDLAYITGNGAPIDDYTFTGGPSPVDPRHNLAPTGDYQISSAMLQPFTRTTQLVTVEGSYDLGFATLTGTFAYGKNKGFNATDASPLLLGIPSYAYYYAGSPANPRAVTPVINTDNEDNYTEEFRLVSHRGGKFDYVLGTFFEQDKRDIGLFDYDPGADVQSAAAHGGSTLPIVQGGTYIPLFHDNSVYNQNTYQTFHEYSIYGDLTWHITDRWQVTGGVRVFYQTFDDIYIANSSLFEFTVNYQNNTSLVSKVFKADTSYELDAHDQAYFTFSQGFRRGGANAFPTTGPVEESASLLSYAPDTTNNYEIGLKGTQLKLHYALSLFYIDWNNPQIDLLTPYNLQAVVVNGKAATSKGAEFELAGPLGPKGLSFDLGLAYAAARLSEDFGLPAGSGAGSIIPNAIVGKAGDRLPGPPDFSGSFNVKYRAALAPGSFLLTVGTDFRSSTINILPNINPNTPASATPAYAIVHGSVVFSHKDWDFEIFGNNLLDNHIVTSISVRPLTTVPTYGGLGESYAVARPREVGLRITRHW